VLSERETFLLYGAFFGILIALANVEISHVKLRATLEWKISLKEEGQLAWLFLEYLKAWWL